jgi:hypothetical protein
MAVLLLLPQCFLNALLTKLLDPFPLKSCRVVTETEKRPLDALEIHIAPNVRFCSGYQSGNVPVPEFVAK